MTLNFICILHRVTKGKVTIACNNKSAIQTALTDYRITINSKSRDILQAIQYQKKLTNIQWEGKHVKGHQDRQGGPLDEWAHANIQCNELAEIAQTQTAATPRHTILAGEQWRLRIGTEIVTGHIDHTLKHHCKQAKALQYWTDRGRISPTCPSLHWKAIAKANKRMTTSQRICITKLYSGFHCTGWNMKR